MFYYRFTKLIDTDPECWCELEISCEPDEKEDGRIAYELVCGTLITRRRKEDGNWESWIEEGLGEDFKTEDPHEMWKVVGHVCIESEERLKKILRVLILSAMAAG